MAIHQPTKSPPTSKPPLMPAASSIAHDARYGSATICRPRSVRQAEVARPLAQTPSEGFFRSALGRCRSQAVARLATAIAWSAGSKPLAVWSGVIIDRQWKRRRTTSAFQTSGSSRTDLWRNLISRCLSTIHFSQRQVADVGDLDGAGRSPIRLLRIPIDRWQPTCARRRLLEWRSPHGGVRTAHSRDRQPPGAG